MSSTDAPQQRAEHVDSGAARITALVLALALAIFGAVAIFAPDTAWQIVDNDILAPDGAWGINIFGGGLMLVTAVLLFIGQRFLGAGLSVLASLAAVGSHLIAPAGDGAVAAGERATGNIPMLIVAILMLIASVYLVVTTRPRLRGEK